MKTRITHLLTVLALATVMSFASCQKETPDPVNYDGISFLSLPAESGYNTYVQSILEVPFTVNASVADKCSVTVLSTEGDVWSTVSYDKATGNGKVKAMLNTSKDGSVTVKATVENHSKTYVINICAYYFNFIPQGHLTLGAENGSRGEAPIGVDTNLPEWDIVLKSEDEQLFRVDGKDIVAVSENKTGLVRSAKVSAWEASGKFVNKTSFLVKQETIERPETDDFVRFKDWAFMKAMLEIADTNKDGDIDTPEALAVTEIDVAGKGIMDITGIGAFKNAWKFDAQDNDIVDGSEIAQMPSLYWLDLKGNKNLSTFDVTGCTLYFQHCEFEVTDQLVYYTTRQQIQVTNASDLMCKHSRHVLDPRETIDWSNQDEIVLLKRHTEGKGYPFILTGVSYLDVDMQDGSFIRLMKDILEAMVQYEPLLKEYSQYIDFYAVKHKAVNRNLYYIDADDCTVDNPLVVEISDKVNEDQIALFEKIYKEFDSDPQSTNAVLPVFVEINPLGTPLKPWNASYFPDVLTKKGFVNAYYLHTYMDDQNESCFAWTYSQTIEMLCYKWQNGSTSYDKDYLETYVKN